MTNPHTSEGATSAGPNPNPANSSGSSAAVTRPAAARPARTADTASTTDTHNDTYTDVDPDQLDLHGGRVRIPRSRGAVSGILLLLLGIWGALIALVGPYVHFGYTPDSTWHLTVGRFWFQILPGAAVAVGGLLLLASANRVVTSVGAWLAAAGGVWFLVGSTLAPMLNLGVVGTPIPKQSTIGPVLETLLLFTALGALILLVAAIAIGRLGVVGVRDVRTAQQRETDDRAT